MSNDSTTQCGKCKTIDGCTCPPSPKTARHRRVRYVQKSPVPEPFASMPPAAGTGAPCALTDRVGTSVNTCATCGFPWGLNAIRHSDICDDRRLADADAAVADIMEQTCEQILASSTPEEIDAAFGLSRDIAQASERATIVAFLRNGGEYVRGLFVSWDSEMRAYAAAFADKIESEDHRPNEHWPEQSA